MQRTKIKEAENEQKVIVALFLSFKLHVSLFQTKGRMICMVSITPLNLSRVLCAPRTLNLFPSISPNPKS